MRSNSINGSRSIEAMLKEARQARQEDIELADAMSRLVVNRDFRMYQERVLQTRLDEFGARLLEPSAGSDELVRMEFLKGAMYAFCLVRDMPSVIIAAIGELRPKEELTNDDSDALTRDATSLLRAP